MLGNKLGVEKGKITGQRVLDAVYVRPKIEVSFSAVGTYAGIDGRMIIQMYYEKCSQRGKIEETLDTTCIRCNSNNE